MATPLTASNVIEVTTERMDHAMAALEKSFGGIRTGKASPAMVETLMVDYYGTKTRMKDLAGISCPEPRTIAIQPWDVSAVKAIEKAILNSNLGIMPVCDGRMVRLPIPELSEDRRKQMAKLVSTRAEEGKIEVRGIRRDSNDFLKKALKANDITEDDNRDLLDAVQKLTDDYIKLTTKAQESKEKDLLSI